MKKIKEEELKQLQEVVAEANNVQSQIGAIEIDKHQLLHKAAMLQEKLSEIQVELEKEYGNVTINLQDGVISEPEEEEESQKPE